MAAIRSISELADKYKRVTPGRSADYKAGVEKPKADWATQAGAANEAWKGGVQDAISRNAFASGVNEKGTAGWKADTLQKGPERWAPGIGYGTPKFASNFGPYRDVIERTVLSPKYAKGDPRNLIRVAEIANALRAAKVGK
uniref:Uncharacterized protein n=1 Tax=viral metagenome TaxID=1070528 RepID=A0A6H2A037_9ZZZZ